VEQKKPTSSEKQSDSLANFNEQLVKTPCIQSLAQAVAGLGQGIEKTATTVQDLAKSSSDRKKETDSKMEALAGAIGTLNGEFTKLVQGLKGGSLSTPPKEEATPSNASAPAPNPDQAIKPEAPPKPPSLGEKATGIAEILTRLAMIGSQPQGQGVTSTEEGIAKGFEMMMATMGGMAKVMGE